MKSIPCPLCGMPDVITFSKIETVSEATPAPEGTIGNYHMYIIGGEPDYSHADTCPRLKKAIYKKDLLDFYVSDGSPRMIRADFLSFDDYYNQLKQQGYILEIKEERKDTRFNGRWISIAFIRVPGLDAEFLPTEGRTPGEAFDLLRNRLLCGDLITLPNGKSHADFQLKKDGKNLKIVEVY